MKKLLKSITLLTLIFAAVSCSSDSPKAFEKVSISKIAEITPEFSSFNEALQVTGLKSTLDGSGNFTVFVPTDDAFAAILGGLTVTEFNDANPGALEQILKYHVVNSEILTKDLTDGQTISTAAGQDITIGLEANTYYPEYDDTLGGVEQTSIFVNSSARVYARDVKCTNGSINVIDAVLTPAIGG